MVVADLPEEIRRHQTNLDTTAITQGFHSLHHTSTYGRFPSFCWHRLGESYEKARERGGKRWVEQ